MTLVLPANNRRSVGQALAGGVAEGLGPAIQQYMQQQQQAQQQAQAMKLQQQQMQQENQAFPELAGLSDPKSRQIALAEQLKGKNAMQRERLKFDLQNQQEQEYLNQALGNQTEDSPQSRGQFGLKDLPEEKLQALMGTKRFKEPAKAEIARRKQERQQQEVKQLYKDAGLSEEEAATRSLTDSPATARTIFREKTEKPLFEAEGEKLEAKRVAELATEVEKNYATARSEDIRLDRMEKLSDKGDVSTPAMIKTLDSLGLPIGILSNPDTEEYRKLETDFIRDARDIFPGGRITNYEIQSYLKTIPTLMNSKEGREAIIRNRKLLNEAKKVRYDEYKNILKENGGKKPANLGIMLEERTADRIIDIEDRFRDGIDNVLDKHSQKIRMFSPDGKAYEIPAHLIPQAQQQGLIFK